MFFRSWIFNWLYWFVRRTSFSLCEVWIFFLVHFFNILCFKLTYILLCGGVARSVNFFHVITSLWFSDYLKTLTAWIFRLWMVECGALSGETYDVLFVGFLFMIAFSSSARLLLIGIATSIFINLLTKGRCTSLVLYCKDSQFF